jgi:prepilin-type N-terminal cleavage/methylation domain-containing protein
VKQEPGTHYSNSGFTLIEILVALFVMLIGLSSAFTLFAAATAMHKRATDQSMVAIMADSIFSEVESKLTSGVELSRISRSDARFPRYEGYRYDLLLVPMDDNEDEVYMRLSIRWKTQGKERSQVFSTILIRHIPFKGREPFYPDGN